MNWLSWLDPKNAWITADTVRALTRSSMLIFSGSVLIDMRSLTRRAMRDRPTENWLAISSPTVRMRRLPRWSMSSVNPRPSFRSIRKRTIATKSSLVRTVVLFGTCTPMRWLIL